MIMYSEDFFVKLAIFALGVCGFLVARHIYKHKKPNQSPLVCPLKFDCHTVVHSDYSKLFGIPVEILGMLYYSLLAISYLFFLLTPTTLHIVYVTIVAVLSMIAFIFSLYLIGVQIFILKKGCFWCYVSALICVLVFSLNIFAYDLISFLQVLLK
jgi:uncharacterized membrane protein